MFIRSKVVRGQTYFQVVRSEREDGKVRQHVMVSLGTCDTIEGALKAAKQRKSRRERELREIDRFYPPRASHVPLRIVDRRAALERMILILKEKVGVLDRLQGQVDVKASRSANEPMYDNSGFLADPSRVRDIERLKKAPDLMDRVLSGEITGRQAIKAMRHHNRAESRAKVAGDSEC